MSAADAQLKSIIDRVLRLKEEQDELAIEIREIYAEAKGNGYDKTTLGQVVSHLRKVEKVGRDAVTERETMFDLYLTSYETGTTLATHTHEAKNGYASQKGIDPKLAHTIATGMQTETGRKALAAAVDIMIEREEHIDPETGEITESLADRPSDAVSERAATLVDASASAEAAIEGQPSLTAATSAKSAGEAVLADLPTNSPETANEMDRTAEGSFETGSEVAENARKAIPAAGATLQEDGSVTHAGADESSATNSEIPPDPRPLTAADGQEFVIRTYSLGDCQHQVLVDTIDEHFLDERTWEVRKSGNTHYLSPTQWDSINQGNRTALHRVILNAESKFEVDHINGNGLDNRRSNLRIATRQQNSANRVKGNFENATSAFKGIYKRGEKRWVAQITINNENRHIGSFDNEENAARAYDAAALEAFGEFAKLNFPVVETVNQFTPPAFLKAASEGPKLNPQCQKAAKGEKCTFSHSMASCWRCTDSAMKEKSAASKRVSA